MNSWPFLDLSFPLCRIGSGTRQSLDVICTSDEYVPKFIVINTFFKEGGDGKEGRAPSLGLFLHPSFFCSAGRSGQAPLCRQMSIRLRHPPACSCSETLSPFSQQRGHWASPLRPACCPGERAGTLGVRPRHRQPLSLLSHGSLILAHPPPGDPSPLLPGRFLLCPTLPPLSRSGSCHRPPLCLMAQEAHTHRSGPREGCQLQAVLGKNTGETSEQGDGGSCWPGWGCLGTPVPAVPLVLYPLVAHVRTPPWAPGCPFDLRGLLDAFRPPHWPWMTPSFSLCRRGSAPVRDEEGWRRLEGWARPAVRRKHASSFPKCDFYK